MNRIQRAFAERKARGEAALVGFLVAGDPTPEASERDLRAALDHGVDLLELGVPFSDPTADGPVIQAAGRRALSGGMTLKRTIELARRLRADYDQPIVLFGYANLFHSHGYEASCRDAAGAGVDGLLVVDLPFEEGGDLRAAAARHGLACIPLVAPTTPEPRMAALLQGAEGFVYYILVKGVTGARMEVADDLAEHLARLRRHTPLPIAAGFGVRDGAQARALAAHADGVVVGSAFVQAAGEGRLPALVREIRGSLARRSGL